MLRLVRSAYLSELGKMVAPDAPAFAGVLNGAHVMLLKDNPGWSDTLAIGDLVEADYSGYAREAITWGLPYVGGDGKPSIAGTVGEFRPTNGTTPNVIQAVAIVSAVTGGVLLGIDDLSDAGIGEGIELSDEFNALLYTPEVRFDTDNEVGGGNVTF